MQKLQKTEIKFHLDHFAHLWVMAITLVGAGLRFYAIGSKGLWLDEAFSVWLGRQPLTEMVAWLLKVDQHPPLYYTLLHLWMGFGDRTSVVRAFSAFMGTLTIPVFYLLGRRLVGKNVGLLAALLLAISPFHVRFAQETRMYTLLAFNVAVTLLALTHLLTDPRSASTPLGEQLFIFFKNWRESRKAEKQNRPETGAGYRGDFRDTDTWVRAPTQRRWLPLETITTDLAWLGYMVFTAATVLTHNTALLFPVATNLFVLGFIFLRRRWPPKGNNDQLLSPPSLKNWVAAQIGVFLLWSPWMVAFFVQALGVYQEFWISSPTFQTVAETIKTFLSAFLPHRIDLDDFIWALYSLIVLLGILHLRQKIAHLALLASLFLTPIIGELLVSLRRPIFYDRTLIWASLPLFLLLAAGLIQLRYRPYILAAVLMLVTINALSLREYFTHFEKEQWNDAAAYVGENVQSDDLLLFNATWVQIPFDFYFRYYNRGVDEHGVPVDLFDRGILEPKMADGDLPRLQSLIRGRDRVWLIYSHNWYTDPQNLIPTALQRELKLFETKRFFGLEVRLYGVP